MRKVSSLKEKRERLSVVIKWQGGVGVRERGPELLRVWFPRQQLGSSGAALPPALAPSPHSPRVYEEKLLCFMPRNCMPASLKEGGDTMALPLSWEKDVMNDEREVKEKFSWDCSLRLPALKIVPLGFVLHLLISLMLLKVITWLKCCFISSYSMTNDVWQEIFI